jgi:hypothetical protein
MGDLDVPDPIMPIAKGVNQLDLDRSEDPFKDSENQSTFPDRFSETKPAPDKNLITKPESDNEYRGNIEATERLSVTKTELLPEVKPTTPTHPTKTSIASIKTPDPSEIPIAPKIGDKLETKRSFAHSQNLDKHTRRSIQPNEVPFVSEPNKSLLDAARTIGPVSEANKNGVKARQQSPLREPQIAVYASPPLNHTDEVEKSSKKTLQDRKSQKQRTINKEGPNANPLPMATTNTKPVELQPQNPTTYVTQKEHLSQSHKRNTSGSTRSEAIVTQQLVPEREQISKTRVVTASKSSMIEPVYQPKHSPPPRRESPQLVIENLLVEVIPAPAQSPVRPSQKARKTVAQSNSSSSALKSNLRFGLGQM